MVIGRMSMESKRLKATIAKLLAIAVIGGIGIGYKAFSDNRVEEKLALSAKTSEEAKKAEEDKKLEETKKEEEIKKLEDEKKAEEARVAEEAKKTEEAKIAEETKKTEEEAQQAEQKVNSQVQTVNKKIRGFVDLKNGNKFYRYPSDPLYNKLSNFGSYEEFSTEAQAEAAGYQLAPKNTSVAQNDKTQVVTSNSPVRGYEDEKLGGKFYVFPRDKVYDIMGAEGYVQFNNEQEAINAGYKPRPAR
jgi:outer membrane biosynthesis protein TonB